MSDLDPMSWNVFGRMMCIHPRECDNPTYVRAFIAWWPTLGDLENSWIKRKLLWIWPSLIGAKAIICTHCHEMALNSEIADWVYHIIRGVFDKNDEWLDTIIMLDEDVVENMSVQQKEAMHVKERIGENG